MTVTVPCRVNHCRAGPGPGPSLGSRWPGIWDRPTHGTVTNRDHHDDRLQCGTGIKFTVTRTFGFIFMFQARFKLRLTRVAQLGPDPAPNLMRAAPAQPAAPAHKHACTTKLQLHHALTECWLS